MNEKVTSKNFLKLLLGLFVICGILSYQNCASQGGGAAPFNISLGSTSPGPLTTSAISLASSTVQANTGYTAAVTLTGADLVGISCAWTLTASGTNALVGSTVTTPGNSSGVCVASLTSPAAGLYNLGVIATNSGGEAVSATTALTSQNGVVPPSYTLTLSSASTEALINTPETFTGTALANVSGSYTLSIGTVVGGVQISIAGCATSLTGTTLSFSCPITFTTLGEQSLYINLSQDGSIVQSCEAANANCDGIYSINIISKPITPIPTPPRCNNLQQQVSGHALVYPICPP